MTPSITDTPLPARSRWLMAWDIRLLLPIALVLAFVAATTPHQGGVIPIAVLAGVFTLAARPQWPRLVLLLLPVNGLLVSIIALAAVFDTHPSLGESNTPDALLWWMRGNAAVLFALILLATRPINDIIDAAVWWRCPRSLAHIARVMVGFQFIIWEEWQRVLGQARLRGWHLRAHGRSIMHLGWMLGSILQRSEQRAQRVHNAMCLRGGPAPLRQHPWPRLCPWQLACTLLMIMLLVVLKFSQTHPL
ncbi:MAG: hypothetical protein EA401_08420 [Planctomycetota bacterium]|nr:MAG: hypothetical protein EA401_08420 [Planctomycetota bacterium]